MKSFYHHYMFNIKPELLLKYNYKNSNEVPKIKEISIHFVFTNQFAHNKVMVTRFLAILESIFGLTFKNIHSKISDSQNSLGKGDLIACSLKIRNNFDIFSFLEKLVFIVLPKIPNFEGFSLKTIDQNSNFHFSISEFSYFPEISNLILKKSPLQINFRIEANSELEAIALLSALKIPIKIS